MGLEAFFVSFHNCLRNDGGKRYCQVSKSRCVWSIGCYGYSVVIIYFYRINKVDYVRNCGRVDGSFQREFNVLCCQVRTVMELDSLSDLEYVGLIIGLLPGFCNLRLNLIGLRVNDGQSIKNIVCYLNCRCFFSLMRVHGGYVSALSPDNRVFVAACALLCAFFRCCHSVFLWFCSAIILFSAAACCHRNCHSSSQ